MRILALSILFLPLHALAATVYFDPQERTVGVDQPFSIGVLLDSAESVNAVSVSVPVPDGFEFTGFSDGNSVINLWIERPDAGENPVVLTGIVPGGYAGKGGRLAVLTFVPRALGTYDIRPSADTSILLNSPDGAAAPTELVPVRITVEAGRENVRNDIPDTAPPEPFEPTISSAPEGQGYAVYFATQDKGSGVARYEVAEVGVIRYAIGRYAFVETESPYRLQDQRLTSHIVVRAIDNAGNVQRVDLAPMHTSPWPVIVVVLILLLVSLALFYASRHPRFRRT